MRFTQRSFDAACRRRAGLAAALAAALFPTRGALAAQTDISISMAAPPAVPRILGPSILGARAGSPFLYTIAATGAAPLSFSATGLPAGLSLATGSGTLSGTTPAAGSYPITITVSNAMGIATGTLTLASGSTIALTPPLGWNSYDSFGSTVTESDVMAAAQAMKTQLQPFGWNTVVVDFLWFDPEHNIDANGRFLPSPSKFPSATGNVGFKPLADKVHALGLSFGIHIMRGIPRKTVTANSPIASSTFTATAAGNTSDPCPWDTHMWGVHGDMPAGQAWYDAIFAQYAAWGVDFIKVDDMINNQVNPLNYHQAEVDAIRASIDKTGRSIVLSLSPGPMQPRDVADLDANANMWRMVNDFWDTNGLSTIPDVFSAAGNWQATSGLSAGHWPDGDMLPLGYLGPRCPVHAPGPTAFSHNQQVTVMSLWSILPSPLIFGGNVPDLSTDPTGPWTTALLTNEEVLAVNQDSSGTHATRIAQQGTTEVWARDLSAGRKAVALFNRGTQDATVSVSFAQLGVSGTPAVRDLWHRADVTGMTTGISVTVPNNGALMYVLSTPATGPGDMADGGAVADAGPTGGGPADSGASGGGASSGGGTGGNSGGSGGSGGGGMGGATSSGGGQGPGAGTSLDAGSSSGSGAAATGSPGTGSRGSSGCSCGVAVGSDRAPWLFALLCSAASFALRRRKRRG
jgi:alpha-galactosidase